MFAHAKETEGEGHTAMSSTKPLSLPTHEEAPGFWDEMMVLEAVRRRGGMPDHTASKSRARALDLLQSVLLDSLPSGADLRIVPLGSYALRVWTLSSNIDCLCVGSFASATFIEYATMKLRQAAAAGITFIRRSQTDAGTALKLEVRLPEQQEAIRVDLTYLCSPWPLPAPDRAVSRGREGAWAVGPWREFEYVQRSVPDIQAFQLAHRFIRVWAEGRAIYSRALGYLSGITITMLLTRICKRLAQQGRAPEVPEILLTFFKQYSSLDWNGEAVIKGFFPTHLLYARTEDEALAIFGHLKPGASIMNYETSTSAVWTMEREFRRQQALIELKMDKGDSTDFGDFWDSLLADNATFYAGDGLGGCTSYPFKLHLKISAQYWGGSTTKGRAFVSWLESRFKSLLTDLERAAPDMRFTFWPVRFAEKDLDEQTAGRYMYLCGVDWSLKDGQEGFSRQYDALMRRLEGFEQLVRTDTCVPFDSGCLGFDISRIKLGSSEFDGDQLGVDDYRVDSRNWDAYLPADDEEDDEEGAASSVQSDWYTSAQDKKNKKKTATNQPRSTVVAKKEGAGKFRPAADVLNRLRWDPAYDHCDFVVGYEDRFVGAMEKDLDGWKLEQTHEEFIPQHRILYFKRKEDGVVVWERRTRVDLVFGSG